MAKYKVGIHELRVSEVKNNIRFEKVEQIVVRDKKFLCTTFSYALIFLIFINIIVIHSPVMGIAASSVYFLINAIFLGNAFFEKKDPFLKFMLGSLLLIVFLGLVSWVVMMIYNLDAVRSAIVLCTVTTLSSFMSKMAKYRISIEFTGNRSDVWTPNTVKNVDLSKTRSLNRRDTISLQKPNNFSKSPSSRHVNPKRLRIVELLYSFMTVLSFYLLFASRSGEVHTVWEVMHPAFIPVFFATTVLLLVVIFSSERVKYKLLLIIIHSILSHVFFVVIFPAGYFGAQQLTLGKTRLVYDNTVFGGISLWPEMNILGQLFTWFKGINFQAALSVILTRMFGVDFFWAHLFFVPLMWGIFVPVVAFLVTRAFCENKNVSVLSSLLVSVFPTFIIWGTYSVKNSLGFIFFFYSIYFMLKYLFATRPKAIFLMTIFSFASLVSHPLTGTMSISLMLLAITYKSYENEKAKNPLSAKISLLLSFLVSSILLPFVLISQRIVYSIYTSFSLDKLYELSPTEIVGELVLGEYVNFSLMGALVFGLAPLLGFIGMIYILKSSTNAGSNKTRRATALFLLMGFLMFLVDHRILRLFMVDLPFEEQRLWVFRDFMAAPFVAFVVSGIVTSLQKTTSKHVRIHVQVPSALRSITTFAMVLLLSGWIIASVYYAYPHYGPLQTTPYELEAAKYIETNTNESYIVISDEWMIYAGGMIVGVHNPHAFYFSITDLEGLTLFNAMKTNASIGTMIEALKINNATVEYFIIEEPRLGAEEYNRIIQQAQQNELQTYKIFYYPEGEEKLRIFYYKKID